MPDKVTEGCRRPSVTRTVRGGGSRAGVAGVRAALLLHAVNSEHGKSVKTQRALKNSVEPRMNDSPRESNY
jgi:hypothetical protein